MTYADVEQGLNCHIKCNPDDIPNCDMCPYKFPLESNCLNRLLIDARALIHNQNTERKCVEGILDTYMKECHRATAWRKDPVTKKQKKCINAMREYSAYPLPPFKGTTKGEASDYIDKYGKRAHENVNSPMFGY